MEQGFGDGSGGSGGDKWGVPIRELQEPPGSSPQDRTGPAPHPSSLQTQHRLLPKSLHKMQQDFLTGWFGPWQMDRSLDPRWGAAGQGIKVNFSPNSGFGAKEELRERRTQTLLHPDPLPMKLRFQIPKSDPGVLPVPQLFPRAQEFPWVFLAGAQWLHFSSEALEANLTITELKFHPHPVAPGLVPVILSSVVAVKGWETGS